MVSVRDSVTVSLNQWWVGGSAGVLMEHLLPVLSDKLSVYANSVPLALK